MKTFDKRMLLLLAAVGFTAVCGGKAVVDAQPGDGGNGSDGSGATGPATTPASGPITTTTGPGPEICVDDTFGESRAMSGDCQATCEILFCCAEQECAGLDPEDKATYVAGCVPTCQNQMALTAVVNGENCETTVSTVRAADTSGQFADTCDNGF